jgi:mono/diheme cytochrome c family protein
MHFNKKNLVTFFSGLIFLVGLAFCAEWKYNQPIKMKAHRAVASEASNTQLAVQAHAILNQSCFRCHGEVGKVKGNFDHILDFKTLRKEREYINLDNPLESGIYKRTADGEMPPSGTPVTPQELDIIKRWIIAGAPDVKTAADVKVINKGRDYGFLETLKFIRKDLDSLGSRSEQKSARYLILTHLHGDTDAQLKLYRDGIAILINSLSRNSKIIKPVAIDSEGLIFRIPIDQLGWKSTLWDSVAIKDYTAEFSDTDAASEIYEITGTDSPVLRADSFAFTAAQAPFYYQFLDLPETLSRLESSLGINGFFTNQKPVRVGFLNSGISDFNRVLDHFNSKNGSYWKSYDFRSNKGRSNIFSRPTGPDIDGTSETDFTPAGGEMIFSLPNGMQGYFLASTEGTRLDTVPLEIVHDTSRNNAAVTIGISCIACHSQGMKPRFDKVRDFVSSNNKKFLSRDAIKEINALYGTDKVVDALFKADEKRFVDALKQSGVSDTLGPIHPLRALSDRFKPLLFSREIEAATNQLRKSGVFPLLSRKSAVYLPKVGDSVFFISGRFYTTGKIVRITPGESSVVETNQGKFTVPFESIVPLLESEGGFSVGDAVAVDFLKADGKEVRRLINTTISFINGNGFVELKSSNSSENGVINSLVSLLTLKKFININNSIEVGARVRRDFDNTRFVYDVDSIHDDGTYVLRGVLGNERGKIRTAKFSGGNRGW